MSLPAAAKDQQKIGSRTAFFHECIVTPLKNFLGATIENWKKMSKAKETTVSEMKTLAAYGEGRADHVQT